MQHNFVRKRKDSLRRYHPLSLDKLLFGDGSLNNTDNVIIFEAVQNYSQDTDRF